MRSREPGVIERSVRPHLGVVAGLARRREPGCGVIGIGGGVVIRLVAPVAIRGKRGVVVVDVAIRALPWRYSVRAGQGERRGVVVELAVGPDYRVVAQFAGRRETGRDMVHRALGVVVVVQVTTDAGRGVQLVVVVDVAIRALPRRDRVRAGQGKSGRGVIESRAAPGGRAVAGLARRREAGCHMVWIGRALVILQVATDASRAGQIVVIVDVTVRALARWHGVGSRQSETGGGVIELAVGPGYRVMALLAGRREPSRNVVHRRDGSVVIGLVAAYASRIRQVVVIVDVAVGAL